MELRLRPTVPDSTTVYASDCFAISNRKDNRGAGEPPANGLDEIYRVT